MPKKQIVYFIGWYLPSFPGGAERSILEELNRLRAKGVEVRVLSFDEGHVYGPYILNGISGVNKKLRWRIPGSRLYTAYLNRMQIWRQLELLSVNFINPVYVITQGIISPIIVDFCKKIGIRCEYIIRDEMNLNRFPNYEYGIRYVAKALKDVVEWPARRWYKGLNAQAVQSASKIIANSKFTQQEIRKVFGVKSIIISPNINTRKLKRLKGKRQFILFVGGRDGRKGSDIIEKLAKMMPEKKFKIVGPYKKKYWRDNCMYCPNFSSRSEMYAGVWLLLVPSRVPETYGRVVMEARQLGISTISSTRGALPEVNPNPRFQVKNVEDIQLWREKILSICRELDK